jgi:hypothetical protein
MTRFDENVNNSNETQFVKKLCKLNFVPKIGFNLTDDRQHKTAYKRSRRFSNFGNKEEFAFRIKYLEAKEF